MTEADSFSDLFASEPLQQDSTQFADTPWKIMLVDDEADIHAVLRLALQDVEVEGRPLHLLDAKSADEAKALLTEHPDIALILLDVVMESEQAGLELVRHIRDERGNRNIQIVLVTGQPGYAPQRSVITEYDIDGYRLKSELTADRVYVSVYAALRTYQAEINLAYSEEQLRLVLEGAELGFWDWDIVSGKVERNERWATILGYCHEEIKHTTQQWTDFIHPDDRHLAWESINAALEGRAAYHRVEYRMLHKDGGIRWILDQAKITRRDAKGNPTRMSGTHSDITLRKQSEVEYKTFIENTHDGFWTVAIKNGRFLDINQSYCNMVGYSREELLNMTISDIEANEFPEQTQKHIQAIVQGHEQRFETRHRHKNGSLIDVEISAKFIDTRGGLIVVFLRDITERKRTDAALRLASLVYQASSEAMIITNPENRILAVNPAFTQVTGYSSDEVLSKNPKILSSGLHDAAFYQSMWQALNASGTWKGEIWNRRKDGSVYAESLIINTVYADDGSISCRVALFSDITEKKQQEKTIWQQANFDALTGLPNRSMSYARLDLELKKATRDEHKLALLFIDLDHFKEVNDTLGHEMGDVLLKEVAQRMHKCVRESDTVGRLGGDEFILILGKIEDIARVGPIASNILDKLIAPFRLADELIYISASIGISIFPDDAKDPATLLKNADQAMYVAKRQGRNRFQYYMPVMQEAAKIRLCLANDMHRALLDNQFKVYYQPIIELATGNIRKAEALLRWDHPTQGFISPASFIPIAEETGQIIPIGDWIFRHAAQFSANLSKKYHQEFQISVNKSPVQFRESACKVDYWLSYLREQGYLEKSIIVEVTESLLMETREEIRQQLLDFRAQGVQVSLDDFGTGYSSLAYLQKFDIDYIKIDQSFVHNLTADSNEFALCEAMIVMAHKLGIKVIAEGVETQEHRDLLSKMGCDYGQGYFWSIPVPAEIFEKLLRLPDQDA